MTTTRFHKDFPLYISLILAAAIRVSYAINTPLIETDGAGILLNARQFALTGKVSLDSSLSGIILGFIYRHFGEHLIVGKLLESLVSLFTIAITYIFCLKAYNLRVAFLSSLILSFFPLHIIFSYLCKGYTFTSFLLITAVFFLYLSINRNKYLFSVGAGIAASLCFFFSTFSIA